MSTTAKVTTIAEYSQHDALEQTLRGIKAYADSRRTMRATSDKLIIARDTISSAFEHRVFSGSDTVKSAVAELRAYRLVAPSTSISTGDLIKLVPIKPVPVPQPVRNTPLDVGIEIKNLPHDDVWVWGNQSRHEKDKALGIANMFGACGNADLAGVPTKDDDHLEGATGVIDFITTDRRAFVNVTATVLNNWSYGVQAHGGGSSATSKGGIDMAAYRDGQAIDGPRRLELFSDYANDFNQVEHTGRGTENVQVNFTIEPGEVVGVPFGAWLVCDHSSGIGTAGAYGSVALQIVSLTIVKHFL